MLAWIFPVALLLCIGMVILCLLGIDTAVTEAHIGIHKQLDGVKKQLEIVNKQLYELKNRD